MDQPIENVELYDGQVTLQFNPKSHRYTVTDGEDVVRPPSVTTVCGIVDKSGPLIGWAVKECINRCKGAILPNTPYPEVYLEQVWEVAKRAHREIKEEAGDIGHQAHRKVEAEIRQRTSGVCDVVPQEVSEDDPRVTSCFDAAKAWLDTHHVTPLLVERRIYSRRHRYSGTLDFLAYVDGELALVDWKSSNSLHDVYRLQTAAYVGAYEEETKADIRKRYLVRLGKYDGAFEVNKFVKWQQERDYSAFLAALRLYRWQREI